jgi:hypothetical protein
MTEPDLNVRETRVDTMAHDESRCRQLLRRLDQAILAKAFQGALVSPYTIKQPTLGRERSTRKAQAVTTRSTA